MWPSNGPELCNCCVSFHPLCILTGRIHKANGGCNQNDSIVLNQQAIERGLGSSLSYHTTRFDIHHPYRLFCGHPDIPGGMGVVQPGLSVRKMRSLSVGTYCFTHNPVRNLATLFTQEVPYLLHMYLMVLQGSTLSH